MSFLLQPYPANGSSGIEWLGGVPEHWCVRRLKYLAEIGTGGRDTIDRRANGPYPFFVRSQSIARIDTWSFDGEAVLTAGDGDVGKVFHYINGKFDYHQRVYKFSGFRNVLGTFFYYYLKSMLRYEVFPGTAKSTIESLRLPMLQNFPVALPPLDEQAAVVRYLDHVEQRVRRYVRAKERLIGLLEEEKQAIINQAVTRGLDPSVRLKASGVEWLGDVPEHWEVPRIGRLFSQRNESGFPQLPVLEVSLRTGISVRGFGSTDRKQMIGNRNNYKRALKGDIAYNMMRMWQGAVGVVPIDGLISPAYVVARPRNGTDSRYFSALFRTSAFMLEVDRFSRGIVKDRNRLYWEDFKQMPAPCPPPKEQVLIADEIDHTAAATKAQIDRIRRQIDLVEEYRTRLIADVVTGKLDVREAAAGLGDQEEGVSGEK